MNIMLQSPAFFNAVTATQLRIAQCTVMTQGLDSLGKPCSFQNV